MKDNQQGKTDKQIKDSEDFAAIAMVLVIIVNVIMILIRIFKN